MSDASENRLQASQAKETATPGDEVKALQTSLRNLHSVESSSQSFCTEAVNLLVTAACAEAAAMLVCDPRASRVKLMATTGANPEVFKALLGHTGLWISLRALNDRRINVVLKAQDNPFVPQDLVQAINPDGLGIAVVPFFKGKVPIGALVVFSSHEATFSEALLRTLAQALRVCGNVLADSFEVRGLRKGPAVTPAPAPPSPPPEAADGLGSIELPTEARQLLEHEQKRVAQLESQLDGLRAASKRLPELQEQVERLDTAAKEAQAAAEAARARASQLEAERAEAENRAKAAADMLQALMDARDEQQRRIEETLQISQAHADATADLDTQLRQVSERARRVTEVENSLLASETKRAELESRLTDEEERVAALRNAQTQAQAQLKEQAESLENLRAEAGLAEQQIEAAESEKQRLLKEQLAVRGQLDAVMAERTAFREALHSAQARLTEKAREEEATAEAHSAQIATLEGDCEQLRTEAAELRKTFEATYPGLRSKIEELERANQQLEEQLGQFSKVATEAIQLRTRVAELERELTTAREASTATESGAPPPDIRDLPLLDTELREAVSSEANEHIHACERVLARVKEDLNNLDLYQALLVCFNALKRTAIGAGLDAVVWQLRNGEAVLEAIVTGGEQTDTLRIDFLSRLIESAKGLLRTSLGQDVGSLRIITDVGQELARLREEASRTGKAAGPRSKQSDTGTQAGGSSDIFGEPGQGTIHVEASRIDSLIESIGHFDALRLKTHQELRAISTMQDQLRTWRTMLLEQVEKQPTPSDQGKNEPQEATFYKAFAAHSAHLAKQLSRLGESLNRQNTQFAAISCDLQQQIDRLRVVPLDTLFRRLRRPVRDAARQEGKHAELVTQGGNIQLDRLVIQTLYGPLLHVVRNALAHGIEPPAIRSASRKPETGTLRLAARVVGNHEAPLKMRTSDGDAALSSSLYLELVVEDDGAGLDLDIILSKARRRGLVPPDATLDEAEVAALIFLPGFSTKAEANALAGRGIGMEVVQQEIAKLGGNVEVQSERGRGTKIILTVPVRMALE